MEVIEATGTPPHSLSPNRTEFTRAARRTSLPQDLRVTPPTPQTKPVPESELDDSLVDPQSARILEEEDQIRTPMPIFDDPLLATIQALQKSMLEMGQLELPFDATSLPLHSPKYELSRRSSTTFGPRRSNPAHSVPSRSGSQCLDLVLPFLEGMRAQMGHTALLLDVVIKQAQADRRDVEAEEEVEEAALVAYFLDHDAEESDSGIGEEMEEKASRREFEGDDSSIHI